ncbi:MAG: FAD-dependent oxidoreductase [Deltaproteobacteria bacterium]|nr:FAD-dependent oxidoreductase [Deltaproteobacteria bacterium]
MAIAPTRRDFVAMLLGAPVAAACRSSGAGTPPGELIATGAARGHSLLRGLAPGSSADGSSGPGSPGRDARPSPLDGTRTHDVVVVGGGVAGLAAAWELRRRGVRDLVVFELDDVAGGTARGGTSPITAYPWGAHYIVSPHKEQRDLIALLEDLGAIEGHHKDGTPIASEALRCRELEERVFFRGRWYEGLYLEAGATADDHAQLERFRREVAKWATFVDDDGRHAFALPSSAASALPELRALDDLTFGAWLDRHQITSERLRWLCDYACRDDYALLAADTSAWAGLFYYASRRSGATGRDYRSVLTWPDGNATLAAHLARGLAIETGVTVTRITEDGALTCVGRDGPFGVRANHVVVAVPGFVADRIVVAPERPALPADYGAWAVANLHLRARPREAPGAPPAWDSVFYGSKSLGYVSATHQAGRDRGPTVWTWFYPFTEAGADARKQVIGAGQAEWAEAVLADLEPAHRDLRGLVERIDVAFWGHGMVRPRAGSMFHPARPARLLPRGRLHFAHTDLSGIALFEEAFDHGLRAAREIAAARGA